eukprot:5832871-Pyramimonas_sp.AAC.1
MFDLSLSGCEDLGPYPRADSLPAWSAFTTAGPTVLAGEDTVYPVCASSLPSGAIASYSGGDGGAGVFEW